MPSIFVYNNINIFKRGKKVAETSIYKIYQYHKDEGFVEKDDLIINEEEFRLIIDGGYYASYCATPSMIKELVIGNLAINGVIEQASDITFTNISAGLIETTLNKGEAISKVKLKRIESSRIKITADNILALMNTHLESSPLHKSTGGTHVISLADETGLIYSCQDIGRHNAIDKLYGYLLINNISASDKILLSSGRITKEMCEKAIKIGTKIVVSRATVSNLAIDLAIENNITLIGFARLTRFNLYSHPERII